MNTNQNPSEESATKQPTLPVKIIHKRSSQYRLMPADGIWGLVNGQGNIQIDLYVEQQPVPSQLIFPLNKDGTVSPIFKEIRDEQDDKHFVMVREFQAGVVLSLTAAIQFHTVLGNFIQMGQGQFEAMKAQFEIARKQEENK